MESACETNDGYADGSGNTSTANALRGRGVSKMANEAGILRIGVGSPNRYCHSYAPLGGLCSNDVVVNQVKSFHLNTGRMNFEAAKTLAHEFGHFFGICSGRDCTNSHTRNDIPDIMVWNGQQEARVVRPVEGMYYKFLPTCTTEYEQQLCTRVRSANCAA